MIPAWVVSITFLFTAWMLGLSPMPKYIRAMLVVAFGSFGLLYGLYAAVEIPTEARVFFTRLSLIILNAAINMALLAAKGRPWKRQ